MGEQIDLLGVLRREADGWTVEEVRAEAALKNIAEGTGTVFDAVVVLRDASEEAIATLPPRSSLVRAATDIAKLEPERFTLASGAKLSAGNTAVIG